ncbi:MAG TPA: methyltransferase domain-containing protein [Croceibacterium sp.]|nr:methyltransferase domain-containing protein [Croceibacterium sp.]
MTRLAPREAYRLWAPTYESGNPVTHLEQGLVAELGPSPAGLRLLDAGCGTGWRMADHRAIRAVGVDLSPDMLALGRANPALRDVELLEADLRALPLPDAAFDLVWCRLAIGYVAELDLAFAELSRVADAGAAVIVTDFHPDAAAVGHRRAFHHAGEDHEVVSHIHPAYRQIAAARRAGLTLRAQAEGIIGPEVRHYYEQSGRAPHYLEHRGRPFVLALAFTRDE